jgi:hypothetical protein
LRPNKTLGFKLASFELNPLFDYDAVLNRVQNLGLGADRIRDYLLDELDQPVTFLGAKKSEDRYEQIVPE